MSGNKRSNKNRSHANHCFVSILPTKKYLYQFQAFLQTLKHSFLTVGEFNAKHAFFGCRLINPRGQVFLNKILSNHPTHHIGYHMPSQ